MTRAATPSASTANRETALERLPAETFPHVHALGDDDVDPELTWAFSVETLVAGLHEQIRRAKLR